MATAKRRTSRKPTGNARKGYLRWKHVTAREVKEKDPVLKGRIALERGAGVIEFPDPQQFRRIARSEGVPTETIDRAFGHMGPKTKKHARRKRSSRRRTSRVKKNAKKRKRIRRDEVYAATARSGEEVELTARTVLIPERDVGRFGAHHGILIDIGGEFTIEPYARALRITRPWLTGTQFQRAFGHLRRPGVLGETPKRRIPQSYGPRSMRLGHVTGDYKRFLGRGTSPTRDEVQPGIAKGQLLLYHKPTMSIVWQAYDDEEDYPDAPILIKYGAGTGHFDFAKALEGAKVGRGGARAKRVGALDLDIPPMAMLQAFDYLLAPHARTKAYEVFSQ